MGEAPEAKGRPYLVLTRNEAIPVLGTVLVAPMPRMVRDIPSEVPLGTAQGLPIDRAATMDNILAFPQVHAHPPDGRDCPRRSVVDLRRTSRRDRLLISGVHGLANAR